MVIKPILFNTEMVKAVLEGRKTQTRRIIRRTIFHLDGTPANTPPFAPGDVLWVRETWNFGRWKTEGDVTTPAKYRTFFEECEHVGKSKELFLNRYVYKADAPSFDDVPEPDRWRPSIHMPKEAARIFLKVLKVRAHRLNTITREDAIKEGANAAMAVQNFMAIWDGTMKKETLTRYGWDANPWVWVIEFERIEGPPAGFFADRDTAAYADSSVLMPAT